MRGGKKNKKETPLFIDYQVSEAKNKNYSVLSRRRKMRVLFFF
jgi:hypothetical protein